MRLSYIFTLLTLFSLAITQTTEQQRLRWGPKFSIYAYGNNYIVEVNTTIQLSKPQDPQLDRMAIWPGIYTTGHDLVQAVAASFGEDEIEQCDGHTGQWCMFASLDHCDNTWNNCNQHSGRYVAVNGNTPVGVSFIYNELTGNITQKVILDDVVVSTTNTNSGTPYEFQTAVECQDACYGAVQPHDYRNTVIRLATPDPKFKDYVIPENVEVSNVTTSDGGLTWKIECIHVNNVYFQKATGENIVAKHNAGDFCCALSVLGSAVTL